MNPGAELLGPLHAGTALREVFGDRTRLQRMLDFEAALARVQARLGLIPATAAVPIEAACRADLFDLASLAHGAVEAGNLAIPMLRQLVALVQTQDRDAAKYVHFGATSQDAIDTGAVLQLREALETIGAGLEHLIGSLAALAAAHRHTPMAGRTWLQHAAPTTFGLKAAGWADAMLRHRQRLRELRPRLLVLQFGGATGTLESLQSRGAEVAAALAIEIGLGLPALPWHAHRDRVAECATVIGLLTGTLSKIARDIALCAQTEVGELAEPAAPGRGGSSTLPHKRNPVSCAAVLAAGARVPALVSTMLAAMAQEHERGLGGWQAEWDTLPQIVLLGAGALERTVELAAQLEVDPGRMRANLEATRGLIHAEAVQMALAPSVGRLAAHDLVEQACREAARSGRALRAVLLDDPAIGGRLTAAQIDRLLQPADGAVGASDAWIDRVLAAVETDHDKRG